MPFRCNTCLATFIRKRNLTHHSQSCTTPADYVAEIEFIYGLLTEDQQKTVYDSITNKRLKSKQTIKIQKKSIFGSIDEAVASKDVRVTNYVKNIFNFTNTNSTTTTGTVTASSLRDLLQMPKKPQEAPLLLDQNTQPIESNPVQNAPTS
jgi:hypothetical protein